MSQFSSLKKNERREDSLLWAVGRLLTLRVVSLQISTLYNVLWCYQLLNTNFSGFYFWVDPQTQMFIKVNIFIYNILHWLVHKPQVNP